MIEESGRRPVSKDESIVIGGLLEKGIPEPEICGLQMTEIEVRFRVIAGSFMDDVVAEDLALALDIAQARWREHCEISERRRQSASVSIPV